MTAPGSTAFISSEYGCPACIAVALEARRTPLLEAVWKLGPSRVRWMDGPAPDDMSAWALDGSRATIGQILDAAKVAA